MQHERSKCLLRNLRNLRETKKLLREASRDTWILTYPLRTFGARPPDSGGHCGMSRMAAQRSLCPLRFLQILREP